MAPGRSPADCSVAWGEIETLQDFRVGGHFWCAPFEHIDNAAQRFIPDRLGGLFRVVRGVGRGDQIWAESDWTVDIEWLGLENVDACARDG